MFDRSMQIAAAHNAWEKVISYANIVHKKAEASGDSKRASTVVSGRRSSGSTERRGAQDKAVVA
ncbi:MAG: hypothetical protein R3B90_10590 [Planctomycetaceae bacterium]